MWITDYFINEGFDATRISLYGPKQSGKADDQEELLQCMRDLKKGSNLVW